MQKKPQKTHFRLGPKISQLNFWEYNLHKNNKKEQFVFIKHKRKLNFLSYSSKHTF